MAKSKLDTIPVREREWEIKSAADTLMRAAEIKRDKKLLTAVRKELKERKADLVKAVQQI